MKSQPQVLRAAVKERLIPYLRSRGFQPDQRRMWKHDPYGHQTKRFIRWNGDKLELLEIQFDKHGRAAFVLSFGVAPPKGVVCYGTHLTPAETAVMHLPEQARLYAGRAWRMRWFGFPWVRVPLLRNPTAEQIVENAIRVFSQVETWLQDGVKGPNVRTNSRATP